MNDNELKWIPAAGIGLEPFRVSLQEKLQKFGWCADFSGFGEGKTQKAMLCVLDVLGRQEKPNILIICPDRFAQSWYGSALYRLGLEFKLASGAKNAVCFFSKELSNLFILSEEDLTGDDASVIAEMRSSGIVWDLMIIDASGNAEGADVSLYTGHVGMKAENLLLFAPYPSAYNASPSDITEIPKALLNRNVGISDIPPLKPDLMRFSMENPYLVYPSGSRSSRNITQIDYEIDQKRIPKNLHMDEGQSGGRYSHGGNIFEEYNLEERKIYLRPSYTRTEAEILKNTDAKLKAFLDVIEPVMTSDDKTAIVYFDSDATLEYVEKILSAVYFEKRSGFIALNSSSYVVRGLKQWFEESPEHKLHVILTKDVLGEELILYSPVTHIINYELPDNPAVLQQRLMRHSVTDKDDPEFIIFRDDADMFDGRVLKKALAGNLYKAFRPVLPCENILFRLSGIENILADMLADIKYIADYTGAVGSSFDIISRFKDDYNIPAERGLTTAARTHEYSQNKLSVLAAALGASDAVSGKEINKEKLLAAVTAKVNEIRSGCAYFNEKGELMTLPVSTVKNDEFKKFSGFLSGNPFYTGLARAKKKLGAMAKAANGFAYLKGDMNGLSDIIRTPVLYHVWLYWHKELGYGGSYAEFIRAYNEGVI